MWQDNLLRFFFDCKMKGERPSKRRSPFLSQISIYVDMDCNLVPTERGEKITINGDCISKNPFLPLHLTLTLGV
ncbi:MAG: hypothetical protein LBJ57_08220, partial [Prevotellaceae bacterium]|nr:hypothetical protein [Prevotellaceae bacterium]